MITQTTPTATRAKIYFPDSRSLITAKIQKFTENGFNVSMTSSEYIAMCFKKMDVIRDICFDYHPKKILGIITDKTWNNPSHENQFENLKRKLCSEWTAPNEFYTFFDVAAGCDLHIDQRLQTLLGLEPHQFQSSSLDAINPEKSIYCKDDVYHTMRFAMIAYMIMSMPGFIWQSERDHYLVRMRLNTHHSSLASMRELPFITVEKKCYFIFDNQQSTPKIPRYHIDRYTVYPDLDEDCVFHTLISDNNQSSFMNNFAYLFNLFLLDICPKYVLMLDERQHFDRNKLIAQSMNSKVQNFTGRNVEIEEHKIADCFAKTIRHRIEEIFNLWDHRKNGNRIRIESDLEAVRYSRKLGLLPIPPKVKELIYSMIKGE